MLTQLLTGTIEDGHYRLTVMLGRPHRGNGAGFKPFPALLDTQNTRTRIPRQVATSLLLGFRDEGDAPTIEAEAKIGYGFFVPGQVHYFSECVADIVEQGLTVVAIGSDQIQCGTLTVDSVQGTWSWQLPRPSPSG